MLYMGSLIISKNGWIAFIKTKVHEIANIGYDQWELKNVSNGRKFFLYAFFPTCYKIHLQKCEPSIQISSFVLRKFKEKQL